MGTVPGETRCSNLVSELAQPSLPPAVCAQAPAAPMPTTLSPITMWNGNKRLQMCTADVAKDTITIRCLDWDRDRSVLRQCVCLLQTSPLPTQQGTLLRGVLVGGGGPRGAWTYQGLACVTEAGCACSFKPLTSSVRNRSVVATQPAHQADE